MPKIDLDAVPHKKGSIYPAPFDAQMEGRSSLRVGQAGGLTQFGANIVILQPGAMSSLRHWHMKEDEFVMVTQGVVTLVQDAGPVEMTVGDCAAFPAGAADGHHFLNRTNEEVRFLVVGTKDPKEVAYYSDVDLMVEVDGPSFTFKTKSGALYQPPGDDI